MLESQEEYQEEMDDIPSQEELDKEFGIEDDLSLGTDPSDEEESEEDLDDFEESLQEELDNDPSDDEDDEDDSQEPIEDRV